MQPIQRGEVLGLADYELIRPRFRARVIDDKRLRRVRLGEHLSAVFENRDTVLLQIQEMLRTERITSADGVAHEIATYNELVPGEGELSVTLFVEIPDRDERERALRDLAGLEDQLRVEVAGERLPLRGPARNELSAERTTAVHYVKAKLPPALVKALASTPPCPLALVVDHPRYQARGECSPTLAAALGRELADHPARA
jgi:hypothetical protein